MIISQLFTYHEKRIPMVMSEIRHLLKLTAIKMTFGKSPMNGFGLKTDQLFKNWKKIFGEQT